MYGKRKSTPTATVTKADANFELGMNSQAQLTAMIQSGITVQPTLNMGTPIMDVKSPVINIEKPQITVTPVINLKSEDLVHNEQGQIVLPPINVALMININ